MDLQNTFYIVGIVFMGLMLVILLVIVAAVFVIRAKVSALHEVVEQKLSLFTDIGAKSSAIIKSIKKVTNKDS